MNYKDPNHPGNASHYHTGKSCVEPQCGEPAGTAWSPFWCHPCNVKRLDGINAFFSDVWNLPDGYQRMD